MKNNFLKSTFVVAIMAASATIGYMAYNQHQHQQLAFANPLLAENLEALADNPGGLNALEDQYVTCDGPLWADAFILSGKVTAIEHYVDTIDVIKVYPVSKCRAAHQGAGELRGNNSAVGFGNAIKEEYVECHGDRGHRSILDALSEL